MKLSDEQLQVLFAQQVRDGLSYIDSDIGKRRETAINYINMYMPDLPVPARGRSAVMDGTVGSIIGMMMPSLMRIVAGGPIIGEYVSQANGDEKAASIATDYVNTVVLRQDNEGERIIYEWGYDALTQVVGVVKMHWCEKFDETEEVFENISDDQLTELVGRVASDPEFEITTHDQTSTVSMVETPEGPMQVANTLHKVTVKRTVNQSYCKIVGIPPDEFVISRDARSLEDAVLKTHRTWRYVGDLIEQGYPATVVESLPTDNVDVDPRERWNQWNNWQVSDTSTDPMLRRVAVHEGILKCDRDGKGIKDWYIVAAGNENIVTILEIEEYKCQVVFADFCPQPYPHTFFGRCPADDLIPIQKIKTATLRQMQDNLNYANTPQQIVVPSMLADQNAVNNVINKVPGGVIFAKSTEGAIKDIATPFFAQHSLPMLAYWDAEAENRTGVSKSSMGLDADALAKQTATASQIAYNASQGKLEMIARIWATGGMRKLFRGILNILKEYQDFPRVAKLNGELVPVNPTEWPKMLNWDVSINTGLGTGSREKDMSMLSMIAGKQEQIIQAGGAQNGIVTPGQYANTIRKMCEAAGIKDTAQFINDVPTDFAGPEPQPPQPSPDAVVNAEALKAMEQIKATASLEKTNRELVADVQKNQAKLETDERMKLAELQSREVIALADIESKERIAAGDLTVKTTANEIEAARTALEADAKQQSFVSKDLDREDKKTAREDELLATAISGMAETIKQVNKPKRIVRDAKGKATGVEAAD
jgi:hypothetical protein